MEIQFDDAIIKLRLRQAGQVVHYFGQTKQQRVKRLQQFLQQYARENGQHFNFKKQTYKLDLDLKQQDSQIKKCRIKILKYSTMKAAERIQKQKIRRLKYDALQLEEILQQTVANNCTYQNIATQFGDISNIMKGAFNPNSTLYASAGGSSQAKVWDVPSTNEKFKLFGHKGKLHDIVFHPLSGKISQKSPNIATASSDQDVRLWTLDPNMQYQKSIPLRGHQDRVNRLVFHQTGDYLFSASYDSTWIFWDLTTGKKLLRQGGHGNSIYALSIHPDGSLLYTGDIKGKGAIWDLRTGKSILQLLGHQKGVLGSDFSQNGFILATGGQDNMLRIWDIRRKGQLHCIPAHLKLVSDVHYNNTSTILMTVSHDSTLKLWNGQTYNLIENYKAHDSKISSIAISNDYIATTTLDRKWSLWQCKRAKVLQQQ